MLTSVKIAMRVCSFMIALTIAIGLHGLIPSLNVLVACGMFFVMWLAFSFAVVLLAASWVVGKPGGSGALFGAMRAPAPASKATRTSLPRMCVVPECNNTAVPGHIYCVSCTIATDYKAVPK